AKVPMVAMMMFLFVSSGPRPSRPRWQSKDRRRSDRTSKRPQWNGGRPEAAFLDREEWRRSRQGKKVAGGRCGRTIEAKPVSGQTCQIEPQKEPARFQGERMGMSHPSGP